MSKVYSIKTVQIIKSDIEATWDFFSSPKNLQKITPAALGFKIVSKHHGDKMYPGQIIEYIVKPVLGIPLYWMTEISHVEDKKYFVDEQRFGPYAMWHHQHHFEAVEGGVMMTDIVDYAILFGILGSIVNVLLVKNAVKEIFEFRKQKIAELF
jgi:ligand-binding SRPBCC domain-containing protein